jgi:hypothetical protein
MSVADVRLISTFTGAGITGATVGNSSLNTTSGTKLSKAEIGTSFTLTGTTINTLFGTTATSLTTTITVTGRDSGSRITVPLIIQKVN